MTRVEGVAAPKNVFRKEKVAKVKTPRTPMKRGGRIQAKPRKPSEFARIYGSKARVEWVKGLPCVACGAWSIWHHPNENAHTKGEGTGRKSGYKNIVPLCPKCHALQHAMGSGSLERRYGVDLHKAAASTEIAWQLHIKHRNAA